MTKRKTAILILAAGEGTRMKSGTPKVLHPLAGRPMILHLIETVRALEPERVAVVAGPAMAEVEAAVHPVPTLVQEPVLGTGHAVLAAREILDGFEGDVIVLYGDTPLITAATIEAMCAAMAAQPCPAVVALGMRVSSPSVSSPSEYGRLVTGEGGELRSIVEFADASAAERKIDLCNSGVMAARGEILFDLLDGVRNDNARGEYYLTDIVRLARARGLACAFVEAPESELLGINSRADLARAEGLVQERLRARALAEGVTMTDPSTVWLSFDTRFGRDVSIGPNVFFGPGVAVGDGVEIQALCHIEGAEIASGACIGPFARLRPGAEIGSGAHIGTFVEVKTAEVGDGAKVNHLSYIGDARIGRETNIGAGTITCNYDGFFKSETDIGAGAFIGSNTALVAPVKVGDGAVIGAGSVITRDVAKDSLALTRAKQEEKAGGAARYRSRKAAQKAGGGKS